MSARPENAAPYALKPYLTLPQLFSLTWLAYPVLSILFVAFRLQISSGSAQDAVSDAKGNLLTSCNAAQTAATSAASMPRFLAEATNQQIVDAVNGTLEAARVALTLALTILEAVLEFVIDIYRSTFLCFVELVVRGGLSLLISASQEITDFLQSTLRGIASSIQSDVQAANSAINAAVKGINKVGSIFGAPSIPTVTIPSLDKLNNVTIPDTFTNALISLNSSIPSLDELRSALDDAIDVPFSVLRKDINDTFSSVSFNSSLLPVPAQNTLAFCDSMDTSVIDRLGRDLLEVTKIAIILLIVAAIVLIIANCVVEWRKYRSYMNGLERTRKAWATDPTIVHQPSPTAQPSMQLTNHNLMELIAASHHPLLTQLANYVSSWLRFTPQQHINLRWFFHYVFHPPALACFLIGFFGILSVELQLAALGPIAKRYEGEVASSVADFTNLIADSINNSMKNDSSAYAQAVNVRVEFVQTTVNDDLFGWVNGTTSALNNTLVKFYDEVQSIVTTVFGNTPLEEPAQDFLRCILGSKIEAFEKALTFLHDNLHIDIPTVSEDVLLLSPTSVDEVTKPISLAAVGGQGPDDNGGLVGRLIDRYVASLKEERIMFAVFLGLWLFVVFMALGIIFWHSYVMPTLDKSRMKTWEREARSGDLSFLDKEKHPSPLTPPPPVYEERPTNNRSTSWESFLDQRAGQPKTRSLSTSPRKLIAKGRRAMGRETLVPDGWVQNSAPATTSSGEPGARSRFASWRQLFSRSKDQSEPEEEDFFVPQLVEKPLPTRPNLTIVTQMPAPSSNSASAQPTTFNAPWARGAYLGLGNRPVLPPRDYFKRSEPPMSPDDMRQPLLTSAYPVPIHHGFTREVPPETPYSPSPPPTGSLMGPSVTHSRASSFPFSPPFLRVSTATTSPGIAGVGAGASTGRWLTPFHHSRKSSDIDPTLIPSPPQADHPTVPTASSPAPAIQQVSPAQDATNPFSPQATNPFSTPFDDPEELKKDTNESPTSKRESASDPFITGRAL